MAIEEPLPRQPDRNLLFQHDSNSEIAVRLAVEDGSDFFLGKEVGRILDHWQILYALSEARAVEVPNRPRLYLPHKRLPAFMHLSAAFIQELALDHADDVAETALDGQVFAD
ncbi:hypothetical protein D3C85_1406300 [compost metagenome]